MTINTELWQAVASGLLNAWLAQIVAITAQDSRRVVDDAASWPGWVRQASFGAMGNIITDTALSLLYSEIPDRVYNPEIRDQVAINMPPLPIDADATGGTITVTPPGASYTTYIFSWNAGEKKFTELGALAVNNTPGAGVYVVSNTITADPGALFGLPSQFLTIA